MTHVQVVLVAGPAGPQIEEIVDCGCPIGYDHIVADAWD